MSGRIFQNVVLQLKENTDRTVGVIDGEGIVIACSELAMIGQRWAEHVPAINAAGGAIVTSEGKTFKALNGWGTQFDYAAFAFGDNEISKTVCAMATVALNAAKSYYEEKHDRGSFIKDIISDNIMLGDIYVRAKELRVTADVPRGVFVVRTLKKGESVRYYFASVTGVDRAFGQILETLKELGLDKNTVVIFASDHGETMCSQRTDDPKNSPYSESMNIPFLVRFLGKIQPRVDDLLLSAPDIMPTVLGLCGLGDSIPSEVQGRNFAPLFFDEKAEIVRPAGALYIQNLDGEKDEKGLVQSYFPSSRGIKTAQYTLALYIDRDTRQLKKSLLFDDLKDPYQLNNLPLEENKEVVEQLYREMGAMLKEIDDPWYTEKILSDRIPY